MGYPVADRNTFLTGHVTGTLYAALFTTAPNDEGVGGTEVSGGSYARVSHASWNTAASGERTNNGAVTFPTPTADWGTVVAGGLMDAATAGNLVAVSDNTFSQSITSGSAVEIADTAFKFQFS